jgi:hypothetical protein
MRKWKRMRVRKPYRAWCAQAGNPLGRADLWWIRLDGEKLHRAPVNFAWINEEHAFYEVRWSPKAESQAQTCRGSDFPCRGPTLTLVSHSASKWLSAITPGVIGVGRYGLGDPTALVYSREDLPQLAHPIGAVVVTFLAESSATWKTNKVGERAPHVS